MLDIIKKNTSIQLLILANILFSLLLAFYYYQSYKALLHDKITTYTEQTHRSFAQSEMFFQEEMQQARSINRLISQNNIFTQYINSPSENNKQALINHWNSALYNQDIFKQIRYLDAYGQEIIRVSNKYDENAVHEIQNKAHRDYFKYAQTLKEGELGVFGVDLEQELGTFVLPYTPSFRVIIPAFVQHKIHGYIIINYDIDELLSILTYLQSEEVSLEVVKSNGSYLISNDKNKTYGDQLTEREHFNLSKTKPELWEAIQQQKMGFFIDSISLYLFNNVPLKQRGKALTVLQILPISKIKQNINSSKGKLIINFCMLICLSLGATVFYIYRVNSHQHRADYELLSSALQNTSIIFVTDESFNILKVNDEYLKWSRFNEEDILNQSIVKLATKENADFFINKIKPALLKKGFWQGDINSQDKNNQALAFLMRVQRIYNSQAHYVFSLTDITKRKLEENKLREYSEKDALTGCWNRRLFDIALKKESALVQRYGSHYHSCLAIIDIDFFKKINDTYGHHRGDDVLVSLAQVMQQSFRETDFIARLGGEEFAIILPQSSLADAYLVLDRFRQTVPKYFDIDVTISGGVIEFSTQLLNAEAYKACDKLLYQAKNSGRNKIVKEEDHQ